MAAAKQDVQLDKDSSMIRDDDWIAEQTTQALHHLRHCVEIDPEKHSGVPVLRGTRFTLAQLFVEMSEGRGIFEIADSFHLDKDQLRELLEGFSMSFDRSL